MQLRMFRNLALLLWLSMVGASAAFILQHTEPLDQGPRSPAPRDPPLGAGLFISAAHATVFGVGALGIVTLFARLGGQREGARRGAGEDALTRLADRRRLLELLQREMRRSRRNGLPLCLLMIDVDNFRQINSVRGRAVGDQCLRQLAGLLRDAVGRPGDAVGRFGGEEFLVLLPETGAEAAALVAERIRASVENHLVGGIDGEALHMTVSIGIACRAGEEILPGELLRRADDALYHAKRRGKNRISAP